MEFYATRLRGGEVFLSDDDKNAFAKARLNHLCHGIFSADPWAFQGRVYNALVVEVTGVSLDQEYIQPCTVVEMANKLGRLDAKRIADLSDRYSRSVDEIRDLIKFFAICAERGLGLAGWW